MQIYARRAYKTQDGFAHCVLISRFALYRWAGSGIECPCHSRFDLIFSIVTKQSIVCCQMRSMKVSSFSSALQRTPLEANTCTLSKNLTHRCPPTLRASELQARHHMNPLDEFTTIEVQPLKAEILSLQTLRFAVLGVVATALAASLGWVTTAGQKLSLAVGIEIPFLVRLPVTVPDAG
jgi:hypothetical protein